MQIQAQGQALPRLLVSVSETCKLLGISRASYFVMKAAGRLGPEEIRLNKKILIRRDELEAWTNAGCPPRSKWYYARAI